MKREEVTALFDQQAASYDEGWERLGPVRGALDLLVEAALSELPAEANVLCVGAGTGREVVGLARRFPGWRFTVVEPSGPMLERCRQRAAEEGLAARCALHEGYLDSLPTSAGAFDAATSLFVSQFMLEREVRAGFFGSIARRLRPGGLFMNADLAAPSEPAASGSLLDLWGRLMKAGGVPEEGIDDMRAAYDRDVALLPPEEVRALIASGGFETPTPFFQANLMHAWVAKRSERQFE